MNISILVLALLGLVLTACQTSPDPLAIQTPVVLTPTVIPGAAPYPSNHPLPPLATLVPYPTYPTLPSPPTAATDEKATKGILTGQTWWKPILQTQWQWQLSNGPIDQRINVGMYDIDLFDNEAPIVTELHARGRKVVCYVSVGSWEDWRPDRDQFPASVIGKDYKGWAGEKWLDIRKIGVLAPVMRSRLDQCKDKGFDGIEPDNIDGYNNDTGFSQTYADQVIFNRWLAVEAHLRGLSIGLKNNSEQVSDLLSDFDWALTEDCFQENWCDKMLPFIQAGKPVFSAEYTDTGMTLDQFCSKAKVLGFNAILKHRGLNAWRQACP